MVLNNWAVQFLPINSGFNDDQIKSFIRAFMVPIADSAKKNDWLFVYFQTEQDARLILDSFKCVVHCELVEPSGISSTMCSEGAILVKVEKVPEHLRDDILLTTSHNEPNGLCLDNSTHSIHAVFKGKHKTDAALNMVSDLMSLKRRNGLNDMTIKMDRADLADDESNLCFTKNGDDSEPRLGLDSKLSAFINSQLESYSTPVTPLLSAKEVQSATICSADAPRIAWVGMFDNTVVESDLMTVFSAYNPIGVLIRGKGDSCYAFIKFPDEAAANHAKARKCIDFRQFHIYVKDYLVKSVTKSSSIGGSLDLDMKKEASPSLDLSSSNQSTSGDDTDSEQKAVNGSSQSEQPVKETPIAGAMCTMNRVFIVDLFEKVWEFPADNFIPTLIKLALDHGDVIRTRVYSVVDELHFWASITFTEPYLAGKYTELANSLNHKLDHSIRPPPKSVGCAARWRSSWHRAAILKRLGAVYCVFLVDLGVMGKVKADDVCALEDSDYWSVASRAIPCKLAGVSSKRIQYKEKLREFVHGKSCTLVVDHFEKESCMTHVEVFLENEPKSVNSIIC